MENTNPASRVDWANPYSSSTGSWYKGNIHTHSWPASRCAKARLEHMLNRYVELGFDFISVSDHMAHTEIIDDRIIIIPGIEWNNPGNGEHTGVYALEDEALESAIKFTDHEALLRYLERTAALVILNHPNWQLTPHYSRRKLSEAPPYHGLEIFNSVIAQLEGSPNAEDKWDYLLTRNRRILGFASDDSHSTADAGCAWIVVRAKDLSANSIFDGLRSGNFYCSTGVNLRQVARERDHLCLETDNAQKIDALGEGGHLLERTYDGSIRLPLSELSTSYVRLVAHGRDGQQAWTQPFFIN